jgi:hypothetical protein
MFACQEKKWSVTKVFSGVTELTKTDELDLSVYDIVLQQDTTGVTETDQLDLSVHVLGVLKPSDSRIATIAEQQLSKLRIQTQILAQLLRLYRGWW